MGRVGLGHLVILYTSSVDGLRDGVVGRKPGDETEQGADDGLPLD